MARGVLKASGGAGSGAVVVEGEVADGGVADSGLEDGGLADSGLEDGVTGAVEVGPLVTVGTVVVAPGWSLEHEGPTPGQKATTASTAATSRSTSAVSSDRVPDRRLRAEPRMRLLSAPKV
jgi:hypothetical protein